MEKTFPVQFSCKERGKEGHIAIFSGQLAYKIIIK